MFLLRYPITSFFVLSVVYATSQTLFVWVMVSTVILSALAFFQSEKRDV